MDTAMKIAFHVLYMNPDTKTLRAQVYYTVRDCSARAIKEYEYVPEKHKWEIRCTGVCLYANDKESTHEYIRKWLADAAVAEEQDEWFDSYIGDPWREPDPAFL